MKRCLATRLGIRVAIYWDVQNVRISPEQIQILYQCLIKKGILLIFNAYAHWRKEDQLFEKSIYEAGIKGINVPSKEDNAVDNLSMKDCMDHSVSNREIRLVILITGDKDYIPLVKDLQELGIKVMLLYRSANASKKLINAVNEAYDIDEFLSSCDLNRTVAKDNLNYSTMIAYEEAKKCLIELIKTVQSQGKKATLGLMGKLIKQHLQPSGYKEVSSIAKPKGGRFSKLSQFVDAVVQEGSIKNSNGNLIVVKT